MTDFEWTKSQFHLPKGMIYLDGNSLGPLPLATPEKVKSCMEAEWGEMLITAWNKAGWMALPTEMGNRIGRLIGAENETVVLGDTLSIKVFQALSAALSLTERKVILSDTGNFPSDLYMAEGLIKQHPDCRLQTVSPEAILDTLDTSVGVLMLTEVDYRTGRRHNMAEITKRAQELGVITVWDLAHSAGATDVDLTGCNVDFAIGCTYKFLNSGPGGPAFIYVAPRHHANIDPVLSGWLGHRKPFDFDLSYAPGEGIERMRVGTPPILQMAALDAALDIWDKIDMKDVRQRSMDLGDHFISAVQSRCPALKLASPKDAKDRGSQVSFHFDNGYPAMQAVITEGVIGDFRAPDIMRFGITPLYTSFEDLDRAAAIIADILETGRWDQPQFHQRSRVT